MILRSVGMLAALSAMAALALLGNSSPTQTAAAPRPIAAATSTDTPQTTDAGSGDGSAIIRDCFEVNDRNCVTANPKLHDALRLLMATSKGPALLENAAHVGVAVRIGSVPSSAVAIFNPSRHTVTVATHYASMSARGLAAVLAHELRHAANWSGVTGIVQPIGNWNCYSDEASAFSTEIAVWKEVKSDAAPADSLEAAEDAIAQAMDTRGVGFWVSMGNAYHSQCR